MRELQIQYAKKEYEDFMDDKMFRSSEDLQSLMGDEGINSRPDTVSDGVRRTVYRWANKVSSFAAATAHGSQKLSSLDSADEDKTRSENALAADMDKDGKDMSSRENVYASQSICFLFGHHTGAQN